MARDFSGHPQRCMPIQEWPEQDRAAWNAGTSDIGGALSRNHATRWRPRTKQSVAACYGRWLTYLYQIGELGIGVSPGDRLQKSLVAGYIEQLQDLNRLMTVGYRIHGLHMAMGILSPERDFSWLRCASQKLIRIANQSPNKYANVRPIGELLEVGLDLMSKAESISSRGMKYRAIRYRDGLILALLSYRPFRINNLAAIRLGKELSLIGGRYWLRFTNYQTKSRNEVEVQFPEALVPNLCRYIECYREILLCGKQLDALWIGLRGKPLQTSPMCNRIAKWTNEHFGERIGPHYFRHSTATTIATVFPDRLRAASALLGHRKPDMTTEHYVHTSTLEAGRKVQAHITKLRKDL